jgi:hypothetical protein
MLLLAILPLRKCNATRLSGAIAVDGVQDVRNPLARTRMRRGSPLMKTIDVILDDQQLSLAWLAETSGLPCERTEAIVDGRWLPSPHERRLIAEALGLSVDDVSWGHTMNPRNVRYHRFGLPEDFQ